MGRGSVIAFLRMAVVGSKRLIVYLCVYIYICVLFLCVCLFFALISFESLAGVKSQKGFASEGTKGPRQHAKSFVVCCRFKGNQGTPNRQTNPKCANSGNALLQPNALWQKQGIILSNKVYKF